MVDYLFCSLYMSVVLIIIKVGNTPYCPAIRNRNGVTLILDCSFIFILEIA